MLLQNLKNISIKKLLIEQIYTTVRWRESYKDYKDGNENFIEIGLGVL